MDLSIDTLEDQLYLGHINGPCAYLPDRLSSLLFLDGRGIGQLYRLLLDAGYRRHGNHLYRPDCGVCRACQVLRIPAGNFQPTRSQRRVWKRGQTVFRHEIHPVQFSAEKMALYQRYLEYQHERPSAAHHSEPGSAPEAVPAAGEGTSEIAYREFFVDSFLGAGTMELRLYVGQRLAGVAILDRAGDALSAVYFYFEPDFARYSPGTYAILLELELARQWRLRWFYPGYYIRDCPAMSYKANFGPYELRGSPDSGPGVPVKSDPTDAPGTT